MEIGSLSVRAFSRRAMPKDVTSNLYFDKLSTNGFVLFKSPLSVRPPPAN